VSDVDDGKRRRKTQITKFLISMKKEEKRSTIVKIMSTMKDMINLLKRLKLL